jgi:DNA-binding transcriptional LysR family regulator
MDAMRSLDVDAVRAFVAVADSGSFTKAATLIGSTQGAVSVTIKRLEQRMGRRLLERTPRSVRLSTFGETFLDPARDFLAAHDRALSGLAAARTRVRLGVASHVAMPDMQPVLARLSDRHPAVTIDFRRDSSRALLDAFDRGDLDAAIVYREDGRSGGEVLGAESLGWFAGGGFRRRDGEPLRLAVSSPSCGMRNIAGRALDAAGVEYVEVFLGCGAFVVADAVSAGLAVAALPSRMAPPGAIDVGERFALPALPASHVVLHTAASDAKCRAVLRTLAESFATAAQPAPPRLTTSPARLISAGSGTPARA